MKCPKCEHDGTRVLDSRTTDNKTVIRRRRACLACDYRFTTRERLESPVLLVIKKDGRREQLDREKMHKGILTSFEKRMVSGEQAEAICSKVENELRDEFDKEVSSGVIGEKVMAQLRDVDQVAFVRLAGEHVFPMPGCAPSRSVPQFFGSCCSVSALCNATRYPGQIMHVFFPGLHRHSFLRKHVVRHHMPAGYAGREMSC